MIVVLLAVFVDLVGFGLIVPILPFLTMEYGGSAVSGAALVSIYSLFAFLSGPLWGRLSDRIGRRPALMMTFAGGTLSYLTLSFSDSLWMLFLARGLSGAMAGNVGIVMATMADLTTPLNRGRAMGFVGAAFALGFAVGPGLAAVLFSLTGQTSILLPGLVAASLSFSALLLTARYMPETAKLTEESDDGAESEASPSVAKGGRADDALKPPQQQKRRGTWAQVVSSPRSALLMIMFVVMAIGQSVNFSITPFWLNAVLGWTVSEVGYLMMGVGLIIAFMQSIALAHLFRWFGEIGTILLGAICFTVASLSLWLGEAYPVLVFIALPLQMTGLTIAFPAMNGELSKRTDPKLQGTALGLSNGLAALGRVAGPLTGGFLFVGSAPTVPFLVVTAVGGCAIAWTLVERSKGAR